MSLIKLSPSEVARLRALGALDRHDCTRGGLVVSAGGELVRSHLRHDDTGGVYTATLQAWLPDELARYAPLLHLVVARGHAAAHDEALESYLQGGDLDVARTNIELARCAARADDALMAYQLAMGVSPDVAWDRVVNREMEDW